MSIANIKIESIPSSEIDFPLCIGIPFPIYEENVLNINKIGLTIITYNLEISNRTETFSIDGIQKTVHLRIKRLSIEVSTYIINFSPFTKPPPKKRQKTSHQ